MRALGWFAYYFARVVTKLLCIFLWRMKVVGSENIPESGSFLMCPVHRSNIDGPVTCTFTRRRMRYLSKIEMFKIEWLGKLFSAMGAIPVDRGTPDRKSLHACMQQIEAGYPLVLFPEGGRKDGPEVEHVMDGAAYIALKGNIPIIPVGIDGAEGAQPRNSKLLRPVKLKVVIGKPFSLPSSENGRATRAAITEGTERIHRELQAAFDQAKAL